MLKNVMVLRLYFAFICSLQLSGSAGRSISVVVKHRHTFAVDDVRETPFIQLPEEIEAELKFEPRTRNSQVENLSTDQGTQDFNKDDSLNSNTSSINEVLTDRQNILIDGHQANENEGDYAIQVAEQDVSNRTSVNEDPIDRQNKSTYEDESNESDVDYVNQMTENDDGFTDDRPNDADMYEDDNDNTIKNGDENDQNDDSDDQYTDGFDNDNDYVYENDREDDDSSDNEDDDDGDNADNDNDDNDEKDDYYHNTYEYISDNDNTYQVSNEATNLDSFSNKDKIKLKNKRASGERDLVVEDGGQTRHIKADNNIAHDRTEDEAKIKRLFDLTERKRRAADKVRKARDVGQVQDIPDSDIWEDVTDEELEAVQRQQYIRLAKYIGWTLLSVIFFVLVGICFLRDPITCIFSFGTGCPCFLIICPCVRGFVNKYLNVKKMVQDAMNKYTPGVIVNDDGTIQHYEPTAEEVALLKDLLDEITGQTLI